MNRLLPVLTALVLASGDVTAPDAASAQCRLCDNPTTERTADGKLKPVGLEVETSLDFDRLILLGAGEGTATLLPNGAHNVTGVIGEMSGRAMVGSAVVRGEPGRNIRVDLPRSIALYSLSGGRIAIEEIHSDLPAVPRLGSNGTLQFRFGGRLRVTGDAEGDYRGDVPITVEYL